MYKQEPPFAIQVELVEGCNLFCDFCGLQGIREGANKNLKFMEQGVADALAQQIKDVHWNSRIEFAMHGEPSLHPDLLTIVCLFRKHLPDNQLMITSNGGGFLNRPLTYISTIMENAVDILALDQYDGIKFVPKIREALREMKPDFKYPIYEYPAEPKGNPHRRVKRREKFVSIIQDISKAAKGTHSLINNHAGCGSPKNDTMQGKRCAKPFRELSVRWDGSIAICCNDWRGLYHCGNIVKDNFVDKIWQNDRFMAARRRLLLGLRDFGPCHGCDAKSYRTGLLPDKFGKETMDPLTPERTALENAAIDAAVSGPPLAPIVLRPWEVIQVDHT